MLLHGRKSTHCAEAVLMGVQRLPSTIVLKACRHYDNIAKSLKINEFILSCPRFALSLHKKSCISAYRSSKLGDSALDLHYLCTRKAASRHTAQASLAILLSICIVFAQEKPHLGIFYADGRR